ncbi:hypothetical protein XENTR_v10016455 [Xenopus tropicalis]|nr:hypothetical protein XENTR_v10016455 [Xenopus tropicalis]
MELLRVFLFFLLLISTLELSYMKENVHLLDKKADESRDTVERLRQFDLALEKETQWEKIVDLLKKKEVKPLDAEKRIRHFDLSLEKEIMSKYTRETTLDDKDDQAEIRSKDLTTTPPPSTKDLVTKKNMEIMLYVLIIVWGIAFSLILLLVCLWIIKNTKYLRDRLNDEIRQGTV